VLSRVILEASCFELAGADPGKDLVPFEIPWRAGVAIDSWAR